MEEKIRFVVMNLTHRVVSRWVILLIDLCIVGLSFLMAYLLRFNFELNLIRTDMMFDQMLLYILAFLGSFLVFQPYRGIVRHTSMHDGFLVFYASTLAIFCLFLFNMGMRFIGLPGNLNFSTGVLLIAYLVNMFLLLFFRLFVKAIYFRMVNRHDPIERFLIFGAGELGMSVLHTIESSHGGRLKVVGFIDDNTTKINKHVNGISIYGVDDVLNNNFLEQNNIVALILAVHNLSPQRRVQIIEKCLELNLEVRSVPRVEKWVMGQLSFRQIRNVNIEDLLSREIISVNNCQMAKFISHKVVLVTGAAGSIGSELCRQLNSLNPSLLIMVDNAETPLFSLEQNFLKHKNGGLTSKVFVLADITHEKTIKQVFTLYRPDVVFHAAAYKHVPMMERNPLESMRVNVFGTMNLVSLSKTFGVERFVFISTDKAVNPTSVMGASKRVAELVVQGQNRNKETKTSFVTTRFGNVLGSNGSVIPVFEKQIANGGPVTITHPDMVRYFMTIPEACELVLEASVMGQGGEIFVFDMGKQQKIDDLARKMIKLSGLIPDVDIDIVYTGLRPGEKLYEELFNSGEKPQPTHHPKIMIARTADYPFHLLDTRINMLLDALEKQKDSLIGDIISKIIPEYQTSKKIPDIMPLNGWLKDTRPGVTLAENNLPTNGRMSGRPIGGAYVEAD